MTKNISRSKKHIKIIFKPYKATLNVPIFISNVYSSRLNHKRERGGHSYKTEVGMMWAEVGKEIMFKVWSIVFSFQPLLSAGVATVSERTGGKIWKTFYVELPGLEPAGSK